MNYKTEQVNAMTTAEQDERLGMLAAIMHADGFDGFIQKEVHSTLELWLAAEDDGFTAETFVDSYNRLCSKQLRHFLRSTSFFIASDSKIYQEAMAMQ